MEYRLSNTDAVEWLSILKDESVDLVVTDPPYESLEKYRKTGTTTRLKHSKASSNDWFKIFPDSRFPELLEQVFRVLKKNRHFYMFCDSTTMFVAKPLAEEAGFKFWKPLVWSKEVIGMGYHYRALYEFILFFEKGKRKINDLSIPDILTARRIIRGFPAEKPYQILETLVTQSTQEGELVIDPFCGSGSAGEACMRNKRVFYGNDLCDEAVAFARLKMNAVGGTETEPL